MQRLFDIEAHPQRRAFSVAVGVFLAISPLIGLQTLLAVAASFFARTNIAVVLLVNYTISNPWTMLPLLAFDYVVGEFLMHKVIGINLVAYNPTWMTWIEDKVGPYFASTLGVVEIDFWSFMIGGTLFAACCAVVSYGLCRYIDTYNQTSEV